MKHQHFSRRRFLGWLGSSIFYLSIFKVRVAEATGFFNLGAFWRRQKRVYVWGNNATGNLATGIAPATNLSVPSQVGSTKSWASATIAQSNFIGITTVGTLWTAGSGTNGRNATSNITSYSVPTQVGTLTNWANASTSEYYTAAIKTDGTLWVWGGAGDYRTGLGDSTNRSSPTQVGALTDWSIISVGQSSTAAIKTNGSLWTWGNGASGAVGHGFITNLSSPQQIGTDLDWAKISNGNLRCFAIKTGGTLWAWGDGATGILGTSGIVDKSIPTQVGTLTDWFKVSSSITHTLAVKTDGTLWGWGDNEYGGLGYREAFRQAVPVQVGTATNWWSAGKTPLSPAARTCTNSAVIKSDGTLWAWGDNTGAGFLGLGITGTDYSAPVQVGALTNWTRINNAEDSNLAIKNDGTLWVWGSQATGRLGRGVTTPQLSSPMQVGALTNWSQIATGYRCTLAVKTDGTLWSWGLNTLGTLGLGIGTTTGNQSSPCQIGALTDWAQVSIHEHALAVKTDGTLWSWGSNLSSALGLGLAATTNNRSSPCQVGTLTNWAYVATGTRRSYGLKTDGTLWSWGDGSAGGLGLLDVVDRSSPCQVGTLTDWSKVAASVNTTFGIRTNGTLWCIGCVDAGVGDSGLGTVVTTYSSPQQVGSATTWADVGFVANRTAAAVKTDGTLWTWGYGSMWGLGTGCGNTVGNGNAYSSPMQIGTLTDWADVAAGENYSNATKTDGSLWSWGAGNNGYLGNGTTLHIHSPVLVATGNWKTVVTGPQASASLALRDG